MGKTEGFMSEKENINKIKSTKKINKYIQKKMAVNKNTIEAKGVIDIANDFLNNSVINRFTMESQQSACEDKIEEDSTSSTNLDLFKNVLPRSRQVNANLLGRPTEMKTADSANELFKYC